MPPKFDPNEIAIGMLSRVTYAVLTKSFSLPPHSRW